MRYTTFEEFIESFKYNLVIWYGWPVSKAAAFESPALKEAYNKGFKVAWDVYDFIASIDSNLPEFQLGKAGNQDDCNDIDEEYLNY